MQSNDSTFEVIIAAVLVLLRGGSPMSAGIKCHSLLDSCKLQPRLGTNVRPGTKGQ